MTASSLYFAKPCLATLLVDQDTLMEQIQFITSMWLLVAAGAALLGRERGQSAIKWALLGLLCGPFALVGAAAIPPDPRHDDADTAG